MIDHETIDKLLPEGVKNAIRNNQCNKIAQVMTGVTDFSLNKIAEHIGTKIAMRHAKWRPVASGLVALDGLLKDE